MADDMANPMGDRTVNNKTRDQWYIGGKNTKCQSHGLIVYLAMYRFTRALSFSAESPSEESGPLKSFILLAVLHVRLTTSPTRPIAWESELIMDIAPVS